MAECKRCGADDWLPNGASRRCRPCRQKQSRSLYEANRESVLEARKQRHKDKPWQSRLYANNYNAKKRRAIPLWADKEEIKYIYKLAQERGLDVDHMVPIKHPLVCGLHTPDNLRCITTALNKHKSNSYWADMPGGYSHR